MEFIRVCRACMHIEQNSGGSSPSRFDQFSSGDRMTVCRHEEAPWAGEVVPGQLRTIYANTDLYTKSWTCIKGCQAGDTPRRFQHRLLIRVSLTLPNKGNVLHGSTQISADCCGQRGGCQDAERRCAKGDAHTGCQHITWDRRGGCG